MMRTRNGDALTLWATLSRIDWRADYDGQFRLESVLATLGDEANDSWKYRLWEYEYEAYSQNTVVKLLDPAV